MARALDVLKKRTSIPLAEMMKLLSDAKDYLPLLRILPEKVSNIEHEIYEVKDWLKQKYISYQQMKSFNDLFRADLETVMDKNSNETIKKIIQIIDDKVPFEYLEGIMKHKASLESFRSAEKTVYKLTLENMRLQERISALELDNNRHNHTFEGITRGDVEHMLRYKVEKAENDQKINDLEIFITTLTQKFENEVVAKQDLFKKIEKSVSVTDEQKNQKMLKKAVKTEKFDKLMSTLNKRQFDHDSSLKDIQARIDSMQMMMSRQREKKKLKKQKLEVNKDQYIQKFTDQESKFNEFQALLQSKVQSLYDELTRRMDDLVKGKNLYAIVEGLNKRVGRSENQLIEMEQSNEQLRQHKKKQLEKLEQQMINLGDTVNQKIGIRLAQLEKESADNFDTILDKIFSTETEFKHIKGPLLDDFNNIKCQNVCILRELERLQGNYRELISDYVKTLDAKLQDMIKAPSKYASELHTQDALLKATNQNQLNKLNQEVVSNANNTINAINNQLLNNNSVLSLKTSPSDLNKYLQHSKFQQKMKRIQKNNFQAQYVEQIASTTNNAHIINEKVNVYSNTNINSSPVSLKNQVKHATIQHEKYQQSPSDMSFMSNPPNNNYSKRLMLFQKKTPKSAMGNFRRNNKQNNSTCINQDSSSVKRLEIPNRSKAVLLSRGFKEQDIMNTVGQDYTTILNEVVTLKNSKGFSYEKLQHRRKHARTTINSSVDISRSSNTTKIGIQRTANDTAALSGGNSTLFERGQNNNNQFMEDDNKSMQAKSNLQSKFQMLVKLKDTIDSGQTNIISFQESPREFKMQKMLEKELPITLHRFKHLMSNGF